MTESGSLFTGDDKAVTIKSPSSVSITVNQGGEISSEDDAITTKTIDSGSGTITITNNGTITSTASGQAIDLDDVTAPGIQSTIINRGTITANNADGIRPGANATVTNSGTIYADGPAGESHDGVDFQASGGTVVNETGGLISGQRHGITSDVYVDVTNQAGATIIGRNGSGVGSDGSGRVINYGTIIGAYDGSGTGDGDGVDIDGAFYVDNYGTIEGTGAGGLDKEGNISQSEGVALTGGGILINEKSGIIRGLEQDAVTICCSENPSIFKNYGSIIGTVGLDGSGSITVENYGEISGTDLGIYYYPSPGSTLLNLGYISGDRYGIYLFGDKSSITIDNFGSIYGGLSSIYVELNASSTIILESGSTINGSIENYGSVNLFNNNEYKLASSITGTGSLTKSGAGNLVLSADSNFSGTTTVAEGKLSVNASLAQSALIIDTGAVLGGTGEVGDITAQSGSKVAPGNDGNIGTLSVARNVNFNPGSTFQVAVNAANEASRVKVAGTATIQGGTVSVLAGSGIYAPSTSYTILTATGGTTGSFDSVSSNLAFLTPTLSYDANNVYLTLTRNLAKFSSIGGTDNQRAVGAGVESFTSLNPVWSAVVRLDADTARNAFDQLSGEIHASVRSGLFDDSRLPREAVLERLSQPGAGLWLQGIGDWGGYNKKASSLKRSSGGVLGGVDTMFDNVVIGVAGGYADTRLTNALSSRADLKTWHILGYAGTSFGNVRMRVGAGYAHADIDTKRSIAFEGYDDTLNAAYTGSTLQAFGEIGYRFAAGGGALEPFAGVTVVRVHSSGLSEQGGDAALAVKGDSDTFTTSTVGLKAATTETGPLFANATIGWQHLFGDRTPVSEMHFTDSDTFAVAGTSLSKDAANVSLGAGWRVNPRATVAVRYSGIIGGASGSSAIKGSFGLYF